jgi:8-oxo-dGTP diphosphatase
MKPNRAKFIVSLYLVLVKDGTTLLARRFNTGYRDGEYGLLSGHLEEHETALQGIIREAKEEGGIEINEKDIRLAHIMHRKEHDERMDLFFVADKWTGEPTIAEPDLCDDMQWFPLNDLPKNTIPYIKLAITNCLNDVMYSEVGWDG